MPAWCLAARPNGTASSPAMCPAAGARITTLASGVQSVRVRSPPARYPLTSQPAVTTTGGRGGIGLRAMGSVPAGGDDPPGPPRSGTQPPPVRVDVRELRPDLGTDQAAAGQPHGHLGTGDGQRRVHQRQAYRTAQRG